VKLNPAVGESQRTNAEVVKILDCKISGYKIGERKISDCKIADCSKGRPKTLHGPPQRFQ
jgi:hypothetical protein